MSDGWLMHDGYRMIPVLIPTSNGMAIPDTIVQVHTALMVLGYDMMMRVTDAGGGVFAGRTKSLMDTIPRCNELNIEVREKNRYRVLWIDSDIKTEIDAAKIAEILKEADDRKLNVFGEYARADGESAFTRDDWNVPDAMPAPYYKRMASGGLGFAYVFSPLNYPFKFEGTLGEDADYENRVLERPLYIDTRIILGHLKNRIVHLKD